MLRHDYCLLMLKIITLGDKTETFSEHPKKKESQTRFPLTKAVIRSCALSHDKLIYPKSWLICTRQAMTYSYISSRDKRMYYKQCQHLNHF